jgi:integrase
MARAPCASAGRFSRARPDKLRVQLLGNIGETELLHSLAPHLREPARDEGCRRADDQELMGHRRIEMTIRYRHVSDEHKTQALRAALVPRPSFPNHFTPSFTPSAADAVSATT